MLALASDAALTSDRRLGSGRDFWVQLIGQAADMYRHSLVVCHVQLERSGTAALNSIVDRIFMQVHRQMDDLVVPETPSHMTLDVSHTTRIFALFQHVQNHLQKGTCLSTSATSPLPS